MPYLPDEDRERAEEEGPFSEGSLNYLITQDCLAYLATTGTNYQALNAVVGVLECAKQEFYRRIAAPYEDTKIQQNGDVYL